MQNATLIGAPIAVGYPRGRQAAPDVPTMQEAGYPEFVGFFFVMLAPAATPEPIRAVLEREVQAALKSPDPQMRMRAQELEPLGTNGSDATAKLKSTAEQWRSVVKAANIPAE